MCVCVCPHLYPRYPAKPSAICQDYTDYLENTYIFHHPSVIFHHRSIGLALCEVLLALDFHTSVDQVYTAGSEVPTVVGRPAVALIPPHPLPTTQGSGYRYYYIILYINKLIIFFHI